MTMNSNMEPTPIRSWGPVFDDDIVRIEFPDSTDWVDVKHYITEEDDAMASDAAMADGIRTLSREDRRRVNRKRAKGGRAEEETRMYFKQGAYRLVILRRLIKAWSFKDKRTGQPIPVTPENIVKLPSATRDYIMERVDENNESLVVMAVDTDDEETQEAIERGEEADLYGDRNPLD